MNNEQQELLDDVYKNFLKYSSQVIPFTKDEFIHHIKTNDGFAKLWGLKIEERELSRDERCDEYIKRHPKETNDGILNYKWIGDNLCTHKDYDKWNIPTKLITITYNDKTIESYE
jgi:hypothetical protein